MNLIRWNIEWLNAHIKLIAMREMIVKYSIRLRFHLETNVSTWNSYCGTFISKIEFTLINNALGLDGFGVLGSFIASLSIATYFSDYLWSSTQ